MDVGHGFKNLVSYLGRHGVKLMNMGPTITISEDLSTGLRLSMMLCTPLSAKRCGNFHTERERGTLRAVELPQPSFHVIRVANLHVIRE